VSLYNAFFGSKAKKKMQSLQKFHSPTKRTPYIDFKPAELKEQSNENWQIVFYWKAPKPNSKMKRFRRRVKFMTNSNERRKYANIKIRHLNELLESGWSPVDNTTAFTGSFLDLLNNYIDYSKKRLEHDKLRPDTYRTHYSFIKSTKEYLKSRGLISMDCNGFTKKFVNDFVEHKEFRDKVSNRTVNNYLSFFFTLNKYMIDQEVVSYNVVSDIPSRKIHKKKIRQRIPENIKEKIFNHLKVEKPSFYVLSLMTYLCFIRRTEITKLKVKHIQLANSLLKVPAEISKSKKDGFVTIPDQFAIILARHIKYAKPEEWLFSQDDFRPGTKQITSRKISDFWYRMRKKLELPSVYQFYSLKDTGITEHFEKGIPAIKIRNQARHENISTTELYAPKRENADQTIRDIYYKL
jgi:integrase